MGTNPFPFSPREHLDDRAGQPADEVPDDVSGMEKVGTEDEHAEKDEGEHDGKNRPNLDVARAVGAGFVAHGEEGMRKRDGKQVGAR